jgi:hypothetical protein
MVLFGDESDFDAWSSSHVVLQTLGVFRVVVCRHRYCWLHNDKGEKCLSIFVGDAKK